MCLIHVSASYIHQIVPHMRGPCTSRLCAPPEDGPQNVSRTCRHVRLNSSCSCGSALRSRAQQERQASLCSDRCPTSLNEGPTCWLCGCCCRLPGKIALEHALELAHADGDAIVRSMLLFANFHDRLSRALLGEALGGLVYWPAMVWNALSMRTGSGPRAAWHQALACAGDALLGVRRRAHGRVAARLPRCPDHTVPRRWPGASAWPRVDGVSPLPRRSSCGCRPSGGARVSRWRRPLCPRR